MSPRIGLSHASGIIAEAILEKLPDAGIAPESLVLMDQASNAGKRISYAGKHLSVVDQQQYDLSNCELLLLTQADSALEEAALQQGCLLISHAIDDQRPAIFIGSGVDMPALAYSETRLRLAGPELSCLLPVLIELDRLAGISRLQATFMRSSEFRGKAGIDELASQTVNLLNSRSIEKRVYSEQIAFNLIPEPTAPGLADDIRHYLGNSSYPLALQTVNVPLFHGVAAAVQLGFSSTVSMRECRDRLASVDRVTLKSSNASPVSDCIQSFDCVISDLEQARDQDPNLQFWLIADPMRYGLANNYMNVVDFLLKSFL